MNKSKISATALLFLVCIFAPHSNFVDAQDSKKTLQPVVKKEGWIVPGRADFKQVSAVEEKNIEGVNIIEKSLKAQNEIIVDLSGKRVEPFVKRKSGVRFFKVHGVTAFEAKEHVFAYAVYLVPVEIVRGKNYWEKVYMGAMYTLFYVDEDGDDIFESRYGSFNFPKLPEWVRRNV